MKYIVFAAALAASPALADQPVAITFAGEIAGKPFACTETYDGIGAKATAVTGIDYRLFVSGTALIRADGTAQPIALDQDGKWQLDDLALLDFEDGTGGCSNGTAEMNTTLRGTVPDGDYVGLSFTLAVPFDKNHNDPTLAAAPLNTTAMFWNWQGGYRFVRIDMVPVNKAADGPKGWFLHLGSTQCPAASKTEAPTAECKNPNHLPVSFASFDPAKNVVVIDPAAVVAEADMTVNAAETSPGCMSFPNDADCTTVMTKLGLPYGDIPAGAQQLVSMR
ncbi:MbnP family copper-binding protein [Gemmobacter denitrificans]|uniref:MbnP family copper-binding protein n=1 Tax=Gemmobacter denitrificans TaxID=3123040 RepID=A0ABU8BZ17_9RHOB